MKKHEKIPKMSNIKFWIKQHFFSNQFTGYENDKHPIAPKTKRLQTLFQKFLEVGLKNYPTLLCKLLWEEGFTLDTKDKKKWKKEMSDCSVKIKSDFNNLLYVYQGKIHHLLFQQLGIFSNYVLKCFRTSKFLRKF